MPEDPPPATLPLVAEPPVLTVKVVVLGTETTTCSLFKLSVVSPSTAVKEAKVTKSPTAAPCALEVVTVTTPLPAPPEVFIGLLGKLTVDRIGVMSLRVPDSSRYTFSLPPMKRRFKEERVTKLCSLRIVPSKAVELTLRQPPMRSTYPYLKRM